jgi:hypothetical protein
MGFEPWWGYGIPHEHKAGTFFFQRIGMRENSELDVVAVKPKTFTRTARDKKSPVFYVTSPKG